MSDQDKWDKRYDTSQYIHGYGPSQYLYSNRGHLPASGLALDLAAGEGRNSVFLAHAGLEVIALDISIRALKKCLGLARETGCTVHVAAVDLDRFDIPAGKFDVIINFNYLQRRLSGQITRGLRPGGVLIFETLTDEHLKSSPDFNPEFLLARGELLETYRELRLIKYREASISEGAKARSVASLVAKKR
jgi:SAM-dependent methyltransferase